MGKPEDNNKARDGYPLTAAHCSTRFVWRDGVTLSGKHYWELTDLDAHCDRCASVAGYTIEADGFYPWHHKRRQETESGARRVCEKYLARQLKGKAEALMREATILLNA